MTKKKAISILRKWRNIGKKDMTSKRLGYIEGWFHKDDSEAFAMAIETLEDGRWIPVTERLPEEDGRYLCTYKNDAYGDGICIDFGLYEDGEWYVSGAIAWMPLPKPYEGSEEE